MSKNIVIIIVSILILTLLLSSCASAHTTAGVESEISTPDENNEERMVKMENGLSYEVIEKGTGEVAEVGNTVFVHYTGTFEDGRVFDSSVNRGQPLSFTLGAGMVIRGWDLGVEGMAVGEKRILHIPSDLAYGESGAGGIIPPNTPLVFEVELMEIRK